MANVDNRVVEMKFENSNFESGVRKSLGSLDRLKQALHFKGGAKGIDEIQNKLNQTNTSKLQESVDAIKEKFSALSVVAITALASITSKAVDAGLKIAKSLTIQPIIDGFEEYETKMGSIQTILANTSKYGTKLPQVTDSLNALNDYADKTIYNFADMTKNIGLFTNAGLKLEESTSMIKGFANAAAAGGASAADMSRASYQLSQGLSAGVIKLMDWRSLTNANMGNKNMQQGLIDIANAMGTLSAAGLKTEDVQSDFNSTLEKGWLTADVMSKYLQAMAGDLDATALAQLGLNDAQIKSLLAQQKMGEEAATKVRSFTKLVDTVKEAIGSGWSESLEYIIGNFDQATELFTALNDRIGDVVSKSSNARNKVLKEWMQKGGRQSLVDALLNAFDGIINISSSVSMAFERAFGPLKTSTLLDASAKIRDITERFKLFTQLNSGKITVAFQGLFSIFHIGFVIVQRVFGLFGRFFGGLSKGTGSVLDIADSIAVFLIRLDEVITKGGLVAGIFNAIGSVLEFFGRGLAFMLGNLAAVAQGATNAATSFSAFNGVGSIFDAIASKVKNLGNQIFPMLSKVLSGIGTVIGNFFKTLGSGNVISFDALFAGINTGVLVAIGLTIKKFFTELSELTKKGSGLVDGIKEIFGAVTGSLKAMQTNLQASALIKIAGAIAILAASIYILSGIDPASLAKSLTGMSVMFAELFGALILFEKFSKKGAIGMTGTATSLLILSSAVLVLSVALKRISSIEPKRIAAGLIAIAVSIGILVAASKGLNTQSRGMMRTAVSMLVIAGAINLLAIAIKKMGEMDPGEMFTGLVALKAVFVMLQTFTKKVGKSTLQTAASLLVISAAMLVFARALKALGSIPIGELAIGLGAMAAIFLELSVVTKLVDSKSILAKAIALTALGVALNIMVVAVQKFAGLSLEGLAKGLGGMAAGLLAMSLALSLTNPSGLAAKAVGFLVMAVALNVMAAAVTKLGSMSWEQLAVGMVAMGGALLMLTVALHAMNGALVGAAALMVAAVALNALAVPIMLLSTLSLPAVGIALLAIAGSLTILGVAALVLAPLIPALLGLAGAIALMGAGAMLAGAGLALVGVGLTGIATAVSIFLAAIILALQQIIAMGGNALNAIVTLFTGILSAIATNAPLIAAAFGAMITGFLTGLITNIPLAVQAVSTFISALINEFLAKVPEWVNRGMEIVTSLISGIASRIGDLVNAAVDLITKFLDGLTQNMPRLVKSGVDFVVALLNGIASALPRIIDAAFKTIIAFVNGLAEAIRNNHQKLADAGMNLVRAIVEAVISTVASVGGTIMSQAAKIGNWLIDGAKNAITNGIGRVGAAIKGFADSVISKAKEFFGIASPSKRMYEIGMYLDEGLALGIEKETAPVLNAVNTVGETTSENLKNTLSKMDFSLDPEINPTVKPVLDLSDISKGADEMNAMMSKNLKLTPTIDTVAMASNSVNSVKVASEAASKTIPQQQSPTVNFTQNNYSPKYLSTIDIYRQTRSQIQTYERDLLNA